MRKSSTLLLLCAFLGLAVVGCKETKEKESDAESTEPMATEAAATPESMETTAVLNANLATEAEMTALGLPAETVAAVLTARPFQTMNEIDALLGDIENKEELYKKVFVPFNLNTTPEADFKMIPGVGDRMAHEFEEYRPYSSIQQFRREIGKYVDEAEVERYEYYVFVPIELNTASEADIKALPGVGDRMAHEFEEYRPYSSMAQFRKEIGKYVDDKELKRLERLVYLKQ